MRRLPNESPRQEAQSGAGNFFMTISNNGEPGRLPSPTWRKHSVSVARGQIGPPRADGGPYGRVPSEQT